MSNIQKTLLTWAEVSRPAARHNLNALRKRVGASVLLAPSVKANAYGHDLLLFSKLALESGADWLCVNALFEAEELRQAAIKAPIYIMGYVLQKDLAEVVRLGYRLVVYNKETVKGLAQAAKKLHSKARIHLKIETGNHRQGILPQDLDDFVDYIKRFPEIVVEGIATHFANIEDIDDTSPHRKYPELQLERFQQTVADLAQKGLRIPIRHAANSAATLLFPNTHFELVRPGIAAYGLWPSEEIKKSVKKSNPRMELRPVLSWKTRIAQIKEIPNGAYVGYGCTFKTSQKTRLAILPVGYYDGFDRGFSNNGYVLIHGQKAPVRGRVCMNITMVDVTKIPQARVEDTVTLLGKDEREELTAEALAEMLGTINYEVTTRIREGIPRIITN
ncbi:MAG: alanine racemase [Patescibacteria group bacterium]